MRGVNKAGIDLIKKFEGLRLFAYQCAAGKWTIGYGHTRTARQHQQITADRAEMLLELDLIDSAAAVEKYVDVPLTDNQFAALVSFVFNLGEGSFKKSTLLRKLNNGDYHCVPAELARWNKIDGTPLLGLTRRRAAEAALWRQK